MKKMKKLAKSYVTLLASSVFVQAGLFNEEYTKKETEYFTQDLQIENA